LGLLDHPNAKPTVTTPIGSELNKALHRVEAELLIEGGDPASLLNDVQAELAPKLAKGLSSPDGQ
jgi:hypothetical protein